MAAGKRPQPADIDEDSLATLVDRRAPDEIRAFIEAETEAQPVGSPLDGEFPDPWPAPDPFGEAKTIARNREEVVAAAARLAQERAHESTTRPKVARPGPLSRAPSTSSRSAPPLPRRRPRDPIGRPPPVRPSVA
ncbi:MAG: hypothetical protein AAF211_31585, partial [Myxococcota bacterium]